MDFILIYDLVYDVKAMPVLGKAMNQFFDGWTHILWAYKLLYSTIECFKDILKEGFRWTKEA